jgi:hypothetical protein
MRENEWEESRTISSSLFIVFLSCPHVPSAVNLYCVPIRAGIRVIRVPIFLSPEHP